MDFREAKGEISSRINRSDTMYLMYFSYAPPPAKATDSAPASEARNTLRKKVRITRSPLS